MAEKENILNSALEQLRAGLSAEQVVTAQPNLSPAEKQELALQLSVAQNLWAIPKNEVPEPSMQRKYLLLPVRSAWLSWLPVSRWATVSSSALLLLTALVGTGYAASGSTAGQPLFSLKRYAEQAQIALATTAEAKADLQLAITKKRLNEAQQVFQNPASNPSEEKAALTELFTETQNTINVVNTAAKNNTLKSVGHPIVASLDEITKQQQALVSQVAAKNVEALADTNAVATTQENSSQVAAIKQYIEVASNAQALAQLSPNPNVVTISGNLNAVDKNSVTVEKTNFLLSDGTIIKDSNGKAIKIADLAIHLKINVLGLKDDKGQITAQQIMVVNVSSDTGQGLVKGESTSTAATTKNSATSTAPSAKKPVDSSSGALDNGTPTPDPNTAIGSFIIEDPSPSLH